MSDPAHSPHQSPDPEGTDMRGPEDDLSPWRVAALLVRSRVWIVGMALLTGAAVVAWGLAQPRSWRTEVSFRPQGNESSTGRLSSLAAQFGVSVPAGAREDSPEFYVELVRSRAFMTRLADTPLPDAEDGTVSLPELVGIEGGSPEEVEERTVRWLQERAVSASTGMETGVVRVAVTTEWPAVSAALAEAVIAEVNRFNSAVRRSQASAEREFVGKQLKSARGELQAAEDSLRRFLEANRQFQNSPQLRFEHDRLQRDVDMRQQLFASLNEAFQQARISEVRNTPVINVLQEPYIAALPQGRELFLKLLLGLVAGGGLGLLIGLLRHNGTPDRAADRAAWEEVRGFVEDVRQRRWRRVLFGG